MADVGRRSVSPNTGGSAREKGDDQDRSKSAMGFIESGSVPDRENEERLPNITSPGAGGAQGIMSLIGGGKKKGAGKRVGRSHPNDDTPLKDKTWQNTSSNKAMVKQGAMFPSIHTTTSKELGLKAVAPFAPSYKEKEKVIAKQALQEESIRASDVMFQLQLEMNEWKAQLRDRKVEMVKIQQIADDTGLELDKFEENAVVVHRSQDDKLKDFEDLQIKIAETSGVDRSMLEYMHKRLRKDRDDDQADVAKKREELRKLDQEMEHLTASLLRARDQQEEAEGTLVRFRHMHVARMAEKQEDYMVESKRAETQANILRERAVAEKRRVDGIRDRKERRLHKLENTIKSKQDKKDMVHELAMKSVTQKLKQLETAFIRIREVTGLTSSNDIADRFLTRNTTLDSLNIAKEKAEGRRQVLVEEQEGAKGELDSIVMSGFDRRFRWREFDNLERQLGVWEARLTACKLDHEALHAEILAVQASLESIAGKTGVEQVHRMFYEVLKHLWVRDGMSPEDEDLFEDEEAEEQAAAEREAAEREGKLKKKKTAKKEPPRSPPPQHGAGEKGDEGGEGEEEVDADAVRKSQEWNKMLHGGADSGGVDLALVDVDIEGSIGKAMEAIETRLYNMLAAGEQYKMAKDNGQLGAAGGGKKGGGKASAEGEGRLSVKSREREEQRAQAEVARVEAEAERMAQQISANNVRVTTDPSDDASSLEMGGSMGVRVERDPIYDDEEFFNKEHRKAARAQMDAARHAEQAEHHTPRNARPPRQSMLSPPGPAPVASSRELRAARGSTTGEGRAKRESYSGRRDH